MSINNNKSNIYRIFFNKDTMSRRWEYSKKNKEIDCAVFSLILLEQKSDSRKYLTVPVHGCISSVGKC